MTNGGERWDKVTAIFGAARVLEPGLRAQFLLSACGEDAEMRKEVEQLLEADSEAGDFLSQPAWSISREAEPSALAAGDLLQKRYRVGEPLAGGGQGVVYHATDELLKRAVVIKVMRAEGRRNPELRARFEREREALARIGHPGVLGIHDVGELADGSPYLVMQYVKGVSLREEMSGGTLERGRVARILRQIGPALGSAHAVGVAHQDLKPENILLQREAAGGENVKLIDFGIAKVDRSDIDPGTTTIMIAGTARYMAPEQFEGVNSPAGDVYSLGVLTCEMLCGRPDVRALPRSTAAKVRGLLESATAYEARERPEAREWCAAMADQLAGSSRSRWASWGKVAAMAAMVGVTVTIGLRVWGEGELVRVVEKRGAFDPLMDGFRIHNDLTGTVAENPSATGYDGWRVKTKRQGYYYKHLTPAQKREALQKGWRLTATIRSEQGVIHAGVDFGTYGKRYDINVFRENDAEVARLLTQILPVFRGMDVPNAGTSGRYRTYELVYDPALRNATLIVDGVERLQGYEGHSQFQDDRGLIFGGALYKSEEARGSFQTVRFEINP